MELTANDKIDIARRGIIMEELRNHEGMQTLLDYLQREAEAAREKLCDCELEAVQGLQNTVWRFKHLVSTINGFVNEGKMIEAQLEEDDE